MILGFCTRFRQKHVCIKKKMFQIKIVDFEEDHQMNYLDFEC